MNNVVFDIVGNCIFYIFLGAIGMFFTKKKVNKKKKDKELHESLILYEELKDLKDMPNAEELKYKYPVIPLVDFEEETKKQKILKRSKKMRINKKLIQKCIKYYKSFKIDEKINLFGNFQYKLLNSNEYNVWIENLANLYIIAFSMSETKNYQEIISPLLVEKLDKLVVEKYEEKYEEKLKEGKDIWNLMDTAIILKIKNILEEKNENK